MSMAELALKVVLSYLLGSLLGSLILGRLCGGPDIRASGSGSAGATNALRSRGKIFALGVTVIDVGKGWIATHLLPVLLYPAERAPAAVHAWVPVACGAAAMVGHVYPLWFGFRGGKAVATCFGALLGLVPRLAVAALLTWVAVLVCTGFVGLASMVATAMLPLAVSWADPGYHASLLAFGLFSAALIVFTHRGNVVRMWAGCEPRARRVWLFGRRAA